MENFEEIQNKVTAIGGRIAAPTHLLILHTSSVGDGTPHIEITTQNYHYIIQERGVEIDRRETSNLDQLLYWIFDYVTWIMSWDYELKNRLPNQDCRRIAFEKKMELMREINSEWETSTRIEIETTLKKNPYVDRC